MSIEDGIIIEDIHIKPKRKMKYSMFLESIEGQIVITSINEKSVPKDIKEYVPN